MRVTKKKPSFMFFTGWGNHLFYYKNEGSLIGFGDNFYGQLSTGKAQSQRGTMPTRIDLFSTSEMSIVDISLGFSHSVFQTSNSVVWAAGNNKKNQLSLPKAKKDGEVIEKEILAKPCRYEHDSGGKDLSIRNVSAGSDTTYAVTDDGVLFATGDNSKGALLLGDLEQRAIFTEVKSLKDVDFVIGGRDCVMVVAKEGAEIYVGGQNHSGMFGIGEGNVDKPVSVPIKLTFFTDRELPVSRIELGWNTSYFLVDGEVYVAGDNSRGQFGNLSYESSPLPLASKCSLLKSIVDVGAVGGQCCHFLNSLGEVFVTGESKYKMGITKTKVNSPRKLQKFEKTEQLRHMVQLNSSKQNTFVIASDKTIFGVGANILFQLLGRTDLSRREATQMKLLERNLDVRKFGETDADCSKAERLKWIEEKCEFDIKIVFPKFEVEVFRSLLSLSSRFEEELALKVVAGELKMSMLEYPYPEKGGEVTSRMVSDMFFGQKGAEIFKTSSDYLALYLFCRSLGLKEYEWVILRLIEQINDLKDVVVLFFTSFQALEKKVEVKEFNIQEILGEDEESEVREASEDSFEHPINEVLFHILSLRKDEVGEKKAFVRGFESFQLWSKIRSYQDQIPGGICNFWANLSESDYFRGVNKYKSFEEAFYKWGLWNLYESSKKTNNYVIRSARDKVDIPVHKEIIIAECDYLFRPIKFGGEEVRNKDVLELKLGEKELRILLRLVYLKKIINVEVGSFETALDLLSEVCAYPYAKDLQTMLFTSILNSMESIEKKQKGAIVEELLPGFGHYFHATVISFPPEVKRMFKDAWVQFGIDRGTINKTINDSFVQKNSVIKSSYLERLEVLERENRELKKFKVEMEELLDPGTIEILQQMKRKRKRIDEEKEQEEEEGERQKKTRKKDGDKDVSKR